MFGLMIHLISVINTNLVYYLIENIYYTLYIPISLLFLHSCNFFFTNLSINILYYSSIHLFIRSSIHLFIYLSIHQFICISIHPFICPGTWIWRTKPLSVILGFYDILTDFINCTLLSRPIFLSSDSF